MDKDAQREEYMRGNLRKKLQKQDVNDADLALDSEHYHILNLFA